MAEELQQEEMDKALKGISIPPRPQVLVNLRKEMAKDDPDLLQIARLIGGDVGLTAAVLKTVNSPFFGLRSKISSVAQAVSLMGMKTANQIATGLMLRNAIPGEKKSLEPFWDSAEKAANISAYIASTLPRVGKDDAYSFALFHNVGIPILMQKFPDYQQTLDLAADTPDRPVTELEDERHATNHATLGYLLAKSWFLPAAICEGISRHHDVAAFDDSDSISAEARTLIAITSLAESLNDSITGTRQNVQWDQMGERVLDHLGLVEVEYLDLKEEVAALMSAN
jgi:HD-like signal output (HDOD) protein